MRRRQPATENEMADGAERRLKRLAAGCTVIGMVAGTVALVGWALDVVPLQRVLAGLPKTTANAALGIELCGAALLAHFGRRVRSVRIAGILAVALVVLLGAATLLEYATGLDLRIDQILFHEHAGVPTMIPGRSSPQTALTLILLGLGIATLGARRLWIASTGQLLLVAAFVIPLVGVHAHLQSADALFGVPGLPYTGMGLLTAIGLLFEAAGALLARPRGRLTGFLAEPSVVGTIARQAMLFIAVLSPLLIAVVLVAGRGTGLYSWRTEAALFGTLLTIAAAIGVARIAAVGRRREAERAILVEREQQAHVQAERAQRQLSELRREHLSLVSHDLRTPVSAIALAASLMEENVKEQGDADAPPELRAIVRNVQRLRSMIDELNDATALESGVLKPRPEPIEPGPFLAEIVEHTMPPSEHARVRLSVDVPAQPILADPTLLDRVLINLLSNAAKYGTPGTAIDARVEPLDHRVRFSVRNDGPPLREEELGHIFDKHFRAQRGALREGGLGLGLYISRLIVEAHGGHISARSDAREGTTFSVEMPCANGGVQPGSAIEERTA